MSINLKKAMFVEDKPNQLLERFREIKGFFLSRKLEVPPKIMEEYSDILNID